MARYSPLEAFLVIGGTVRIKNWYDSLGENTKPAVIVAGITGVLAIVGAIITGVFAIVNTELAKPAAPVPVPATTSRPSTPAPSVILSPTATPPAPSPTVGGTVLSNPYVPA